MIQSIHEKKTNFFSFLLALMAALFLITPFAIASASVHAASTTEQTTFQNDAETIDQVAADFADLFTSGIKISGDSYTINFDYLNSRYSRDEISGILALMEETSLVNQSSSRAKRSVASFLVCMKDKAVSDIKDMFNVGKFTVLLGKKAWKQAAAFAVKWLAKQGIKRNLAATVALLAWYGVQCVGH
jgi:hypothetical protein